MEDSLNISLLDKAIELQKNGNLEEALSCYKTVIKYDPNNSEAFHLLGTIYYQKNDLNKAIFYFKQAIDLNDRNYLALNSLALIYTEMANAQTAEPLLQKAISINPAHAESFFNLGNLLLLTNKIQDAFTNFIKAFELDKSETKYLWNAVSCFEQLNDIEGEINFLIKNEFLFNEKIRYLDILSTLFFHKKEYNTAADYALKALKLDSHNYIVLNNLCSIYTELGNYKQALSYGLESIRQNKNFGLAYSNVGNIYIHLKDYENAIKFTKYALILNPNDALCYYNLGNVYKDLKDFNQAIYNYKKSLEIYPSNIDTLNNLGIAYHMVCDYPKGLRVFEELQKVSPDNADVIMNLANSYQYNFQFDEAIEYYKKAILLNPNNPFIHKNLGICYFLNNDYKNGWNEFEWRLKTDEIKKRIYKKPKYFDQKIENKTILFHAEQGLGDSINFVKYLKYFKDKGAKIYLECQKSLIRLFSNLPYIDKLIVLNEELNFDYDYHLSLMSVGRILNIAPNTEISSKKYLEVDQTDISSFAKYISNNKIKCGIVWAGNPQHKNDHNRSIQLRYFTDLFSTLDVDVYSLQVGQLSVSNIELLEKNNIPNCGQYFNDFYDTACFIENLDFVITIDTSVAHISAALGKKTLMLLPYAPDWRWGICGETTFWYDSMVLFRQKKPNDWDSAFNELYLYLKNNNMK